MATETIEAATIEAAVNRLRHARDESERLAARWTTARLAFEAEHVDLTAAQTVAIAEEDAADLSLRKIALAVWEAGDKTTKMIRPGIAIREVQVVYYDPMEALDWAKKSELCLMLDAAKFKKLAVADVAGVIPAGLTRVVKEPQATISKDLP